MRSMKKIYVLFIILTGLFSSQIVAQERLIENYTVSLYFGIKNVSRDSFPNKEHLDFMNYMYAEDDYLDFEYIGFSGKITFRGNWQGAFNLGFLDDLTLSKLHVSARYFPFGSVGFLAGVYGDGMMMNEFSSFHKLEDEGMIGDINTNFRQRFPFDIGILGGLIFQKEFRFMEASVVLNAGTSSVMPFEEIVAQKAVNGNLRRLIEYKTQYTFDAFFMPEVKVGVNLVTKETYSIGFQLQADWKFSKKRIHYNKNIYEWDKTNPNISSIKTPAHNYHVVSVDAGFFFKW